MDSEYDRLFSHHEKKANWKNWGPYLSERSWATVREDSSSSGDVWNSFSHEQSRSRIYRWGEDGIGGFSDRFGRLCLSFAFWNGKDPILKERLFGLTNPEGNHGEDVKELYFYLDGTPTHSYMKMLYKYPQEPFPYEKLVHENKKRTLRDPEYELLDTGVFNENGYFDIFIEYAKENEEEFLARATIINRGPKEALIHFLPQILLRNTWKWGYEKGPTGDEGPKRKFTLHNSALQLDGSFIYFEGDPHYFFTENEPEKKDAFHHYIVHGDKKKLNLNNEGSKACAHYQTYLKPGQTAVFKLKFSKQQSAPFANFDSIFEQRIKEADQFYARIQNPNLSAELKKIQRQAFAGLLWNKQLYYLDQEQWKKGDPKHPISRKEKRNQDWDNFFAFDVISMPDKWEYPYFCAWDLAFHCLSFVLIDPDFAKRQLILMTREWYMHPNGQLPAHEWNFSDVNPPVHAWAVWRTYKIDAKIFQKDDRGFLESCFHKLLINFTWWVNKKDIEGNNLFQGGFLGMDNISIFDRNRELPTGGHIDQSDGSAWMAFYCILMMKIALHLSVEEKIYQDIASKFFEHFMRIAAAMTNIGGQGISLWNEEDGFFYDVLHLPNGKMVSLKVRSLVGLLPLLAVETIDPDLLEKAPDFIRRMNWFISKRPDVSCNLSCIYKEGQGGRRLMAILTKEKLQRILRYMLDEKEFLSPYGLRSLSRIHKDQPYMLQLDGSSYEIRYAPAESDNRIFGGNSNWRGPVWFPINFLIIESLQKFHHYFGDDFKAEFPTGSGNYLNLWDVSIELSKRLMRLFVPDAQGHRPIYKKEHQFQDQLLFHEYFNGDTGEGLGASHQTGWTALIAKLIQQSGEFF